MCHKSIDILNDIRIKMFYDMSLTENENKFKLKKQISEQTKVPQVTTTTTTLKPTQNNTEDESTVSGFFEKPYQPTQLTPTTYSGAEQSVDEYITPEQEMELFKGKPTGFFVVIKDNSNDKYNQTRTIKRKVPHTPDDLDPSTYSIEVVTQVWDPKAQNRTSNPTIVRDPYRPDGFKTVYPTGNWVDMTYKNVGLRGTPYGFHPEEYPKYLEELKNLKKQFQSSGEIDKTKIKSDYLGKDGEFEKKYGINSRQKLEKDLYDKYYHDEFWKGIKSDNYNDYKKLLSNYEKEFEDKSKRVKETYGTDDWNWFQEAGYQMYNKVADPALPDPFSNKTNAAITSHRFLDKNIEELQSELEYKKLLLGIVYDYNPEEYDKILEERKPELVQFWNNWGWSIELAGFIIVDAFSGGLVEAVTAERQLSLAGKLVSKFAPKVVSKFQSFSNPTRAVKLAKLAAQSGLPLGISAGIYLNEGKFTEHGLMYLCFAFLPYLHEFYGWGPPPPLKSYQQAADSIIAKMGRYNLKSPFGFRRFMRSITDEEKYWVAKVWFMSENLLEKGIEHIAKKVGQRTAKLIEAELQALYYHGMGAVSQTIVYSVPKPILSRFAKGAIKFIGVMAHDIALMKLIKKQLENFGIMDVNRQEEFIKKYKQLLKENPIDDKLKVFAVTELLEIIKNEETITPEGAIDRLKFKLSELSPKSDIVINLETINNTNNLGIGEFENLVGPDGKPITKDDMVSDEELDLWIKSGEKME